MTNMQGWKKLLKYCKKPQIQTQIHSGLKCFNLHQCWHFLTNKTNYKPKYISLNIKRKSKFSLFTPYYMSMFQTHSQFRTPNKTRYSHLQRASTQAKSLRNFIRINSYDKNETTSFKWEPVTLAMKIKEKTSLTRSVSENKLSYGSKKKILTALTHENSHKTPSKNLQTILCAKLNLGTSPAAENNNLDSYEEEKLHRRLQVKTAMQSRASQERRDRMMDSKLEKYSDKPRFVQRKLRTSNDHRSRAQRPTKVSETVLLSTSQSESRLGERNGQSLSDMVESSSRTNKRVIAIFAFRRYGLRMRMSSSYLPICKCSNKSHAEHKLEQSTSAKKLVQKMLPHTSQARFYYFFIDGEPVTNVSCISPLTYCIIASISPKLEIESEYHTKLEAQFQKFETSVKEIQQSLGIQRVPEEANSNYSIEQFQADSESHSEEQYDWQKIKDIDKYVSQVCQNPEIIKQNTKKQQKSDKEFEIIKAWCEETFEDRSAQADEKKGSKQRKNPLLQELGHYPKQMKDKQGLSAVSHKLESRTDIFKNSHKQKVKTIERMIEKVKREKQPSFSIDQEESKPERNSAQKAKPNIINRNVENALASKGALMRRLESKNTLLSTQNVPYMMEKYGVNRFELHNLYNLYKTLEKISGLRLHHTKQSRNSGQESNKQSLKVLEKGIDRDTFDEGMKRLDINPGDEVIKNICYFGDFISWEQFIKIISISLRKTPEEKLEAILVGIGGVEGGMLTKKHIRIMVGNSLYKIFDREQPELRDYFTEVAMNDLDEDGSGDIDIEEIKAKVLKLDPNNLDLVSFLLLNS